MDTAIRIFAALFISVIGSTSVWILLEDIKQAKRIERLYKALERAQK